MNTTIIYLGHYAAPPAADRFTPASLAEIKAAITVLERAQDENSADDLAVAEDALTLHRQGAEILMAEDEDGYYFAVQHTVRSLASEAMLDHVHASSIDPAVASALLAESADTREEADARIAEVLS